MFSIVGLYYNINSTPRVCNRFSFYLLAMFKSEFLRHFERWMSWLSKYVQAYIDSTINCVVLFFFKRVYDLVSAVTQYNHVTVYLSYFWIEFRLTFSTLYRSFIIIMIPHRPALNKCETQTKSADNNASFSPFLLVLPPNLPSIFHYRFEFNISRQLPKCLHPWILPGVFPHYIIETARGDSTWELVWLPNPFLCLLFQLYFYSPRDALTMGAFAVLSLATGQPAYFR